MKHFFDVAFTPDVLARQQDKGSFEHYGGGHVEWPAPHGLGPEEQAFLAARDSVYVSTVSQDGWPYVQHRGGPKGFIAVLDHHRIGWIDRAGNRQFVTAGNLDGDDRIAIIAVDYPMRRRLKLLGHATFVADPDAAQLAPFGDVTGRVEGLVSIEVVAFDWNCPKFITPRYTADEVRAVNTELLQRIEALEAELARVGRDDAASVNEVPRDLDQRKS